MFQIVRSEPSELSLEIRMIYVKVSGSTLGALALSAIERLSALQRLSGMPSWEFVPRKTVEGLLLGFGATLEGTRQTLKRLTRDQLIETEGETIKLEIQILEEAIAATLLEPVEPGIASPVPRSQPSEPSPVRSRVKEYISNNSQVNQVQDPDLELDVQGLDLRTCFSGFFSLFFESVLELPTPQVLEFGLGQVSLRKDHSTPFEDQVRLHNTRTDAHAPVGEPETGKKPKQSSRTIKLSTTDVNKMLEQYPIPGKLVDRVQSLGNTYEELMEALEFYITTRQKGQRPVKFSGQLKWIYDELMMPKIQNPVRSLSLSGSMGYMKLFTPDEDLESKSKQTDPTQDDRMEEYR
jgi:hypothetical protein